MDAETRRFVRTRANERCEYYGIHQRIYPDFAFHIEHIVARQHGGEMTPTNLALSCHLCNSKKGPNLSGIDPETAVLTRLFPLVPTAGTSISKPRAMGRS
jgi:5-methylcytosine-specific restriction endonuclease McrA